MMDMEHQEEATTNPNDRHHGQLRMLRTVIGVRHLGGQALARIELFVRHLVVVYHDSLGGKVC